MHGLASITGDFCIGISLEVPHISHGTHLGKLTNTNTGYGNISPTSTLNVDNINKHIQHRNKNNVTVVRDK